MHCNVSVNKTLTSVFPNAVIDLIFSLGHESVISSMAVVSSAGRSEQENLCCWHEHSHLKAPKVSGPWNWQRCPRVNLRGLTKLSFSPTVNVDAENNFSHSPGIYDLETALL